MPVSRTASLLALLLVVLAAAAPADALPPWQDWQTGLDADNPLIGKIWSQRQSRFVTPRQLVDALAQTRFLLIGETHDNADHHRLQAWLIEAISDGGKPAVVMEMVAKDQSDELNAYLASPGATAEGLGNALDWAKSGWPAWPLYQPIAEAVWRAGLPLAAGNPAGETTRRISREGIAALDPAERRLLGLDRALEPVLDEALRADIRRSHCDLLPEEAIGPATVVQRFRDASLAAAMRSADRGDGAILIAGNGHVRTDRAVPLYLVRHTGEDTLSVVMLLEVEEGGVDVADYAETGPDGSPIADFLWFTPRAEREDQCEKVRERFGK